MNILSVSQLKQADQHTLLQEPISAVGLMERAAVALVQYIREHFPDLRSFVVCCGPGNNGGDGLAMAGLLHAAGMEVQVLILAGNYTPEFVHYREQLHQQRVTCIEITGGEQLAALEWAAGTCVIDALYGIGLSRPVTGTGAQLIRKMNALRHFTIAVDVPSGLSPDAEFASTPEDTVCADLTLAIQLPKLAFFFAEHQPYVGRFACVDIGLSAAFIRTQETMFHFSEPALVRSLVQPRPDFGHKGTFGHALVIAGSEGKTGAAILACRAALKTGCGYVTACVPEAVQVPLLCTLPEAMQLSQDPELLIAKGLDIFDAIGFGPGTGMGEEMAGLLQHLLSGNARPLVIDADGLTLLSQHREWYSLLYPQCVLTPHPKEFDRLTRVHASGRERLLTQREFSATYRVTVVLKGRYTSVTTPEGGCWFNTTGNNGMATAGSGDVLTGIITALCAQGYTPQQAAILGVYLHGYAGDSAAAQVSHTSLVASDIIDHIGRFFLEFEK